MIRLSTWNLCLGIKNKKDYVYETLINNKIEICAVQETEIKKNYPVELLTHRDYKIEIEQFSEKGRCAIIIKNTINYLRRKDLEKLDSSVVIIDIDATKKYRIINIYRSFTPPNGKTQKQAFIDQLAIIKNATETANNFNIVVLGDFNLDELKRNGANYPFKDYYTELDNCFDPLNLIQMINFPTWQRTVNNSNRESILDHIYVTNPLIIKSIRHLKPLMGDHLILLVELNVILTPPKIVKKRDWRKYTKDILLTHLSRANFDLTSNSSQSIWNHFEMSLLPIIDELVPLVDFINNTKTKNQNNKTINSKLNLRKRLLKSNKTNPKSETNKRIRCLNHEIKMYYDNIKKNSIQRSIIPGNSKSLWNAVKIAKNTNVSSIPISMYLNGQLISEQEIPDAFASFFYEKIKNIVTLTEIDQTVYNGTNKLHAANENFMSEMELIAAINSLAFKNCEGHDRIPQRIIKDGINMLLGPLSYLFDTIYKTKEIPQQWLISKVNPIFKKGNSSDIENYRPVSNLCSTSKIFEKLILLRIQKLEALNRIDLTGKSQHGFKRKHSTATAGLTIQSLIARALNDDNFALMASLDLSAAFDVVNVELLIKRLRIIGLPNDVIELIQKWLTGRSFYVSIDGLNSCVYPSDFGTVQGSILGPILYALFVSPLMDLADLTLFADDNFILTWNKCVNQLIVDMERSIEMITKWLRQSGLKVNETKTEACLFHRKDHPPLVIQINANVITTKPSMNVLGVLFDSKLQWQPQVSNTISKSKRALHALTMIRKYFNKEQLLNIITSCYYSILYYNSEIWHLPQLSPQLKQNLLAASAAPLKLTTPNYHRMMSYESLHYMNKRATPIQITLYKHSLLLHKIYNDESMGLNWVNLFFNQNFNERDNSVKFFNTSNYKVGNNIIANRFVILNGKIPNDWLNSTFENYKIKCKVLFLQQ